MPQAKNTSQKAYVCRFNGGQFDADYETGGTTKADKGSMISMAPGSAPAKVRPAGNKDSYKSGKKVQEFTAAHVGGGHDRGHQG